MEDLTVTDDERDLGFGYSTEDPYLTENDDDPRPIRRDDRAEAEADDMGRSDDDSNQSPVSDPTGSERFDADPEEGRGRVSDQARIGDADFRTQEAVYHDYVERQSER